MDYTDLDTGVSAPDELDLATEESVDPGEIHEIDCLLAGRFFTIATAGTISAWNDNAERAFGFTNGAVIGKSFVEKMVAPSERETRAAEVSALLANEGPPVAVHIQTRAVNAAGAEYAERFSLVPIRLHDGYAINGLLQDVAKNRRAGDRERLLKSHPDVLGRIGAELTGRVLEPPEEAGEDAHRLVGALVIFDGAEAPVVRAPSENGESGEDDLEGARHEIDQLRAQIERMRRETEEARHDAELAREEVEQTRAKLNEVRGTADEDHGRAEQLDVELSKLRDAIEAGESELEQSRARAGEAGGAPHAPRAQRQGGAPANEAPKGGAGGGRAEGG